MVWSTFWRSIKELKNLPKLSCGFNLLFSLESNLHTLAHRCCQVKQPLPSFGSYHDELMRRKFGMRFNLCKIYCKIMHTVIPGLVQLNWDLYPFQTDFTRWHPLNSRWINGENSARKTPINFSSTLSDQTPMNTDENHSTANDVVSKPTAQQEVYVAAACSTQTSSHFHRCSPGSLSDRISSPRTTVEHRWTLD